MRSDSRGDLMMLMSGNDLRCYSHSFRRNFCGSVGLRVLMVIVLSLLSMNAIRGFDLG